MGGHSDRDYYLLAVYINYVAPAPTTEESSTLTLLMASSELERK